MITASTIVEVGKRENIARYSIASLHIKVVSLHTGIGFYSKITRAELSARADA